MMLLSKKILDSLLLMVPVFVYACPELQGSYKVEQRADLYIQKQSDDSYLAMVESEDHQPQFLSVIRPEAKELKEQGYPECTAIIKGLGLLMPSDKNKTYQVTSESQNYQTGKSQEHRLSSCIWPVFSRTFSAWIKYLRLFLRLLLTAITREAINARRNSTWRQPFSRR